MIGIKVDKLRKLQAMTGSSNINESELAMKHLEKLMQQHNIESFSQKDEDFIITQDYIWESKMLKTWKIHLANIVADLFQCSVYYKQGVDKNDNYKIKKMLMFNGTKEDIDLSINMYQWLVNVCIECKNKAKKQDNSIDPYAFYTGFVRALKRKVDVILEQRRADFKASNSTALIILDKKETALSEYMSQFDLANVKRDSKTGSGYNEGYKSGNQVNMTNQMSTNSVGQHLLR